MFSPSRTPRAPLKKNPLKSLTTMLRLNPYAKVQRRRNLELEQKRRKARQEGIDKKRKMKK